MPIIPDPCLQQVVHDGPLHIEFFDKMGQGRRFYDVVVASATFDITAEGLVLSPTPQPFTWADRYFDESDVEHSSLRRVGDAVLYKPGTDLLLTGHAQAPGHHASNAWRALVGISHQGQWCVSLGWLLTGPCEWRFDPTNTRWRRTPPQPTDRVPLRHELAHGGLGTPNPVGVGAVDLAGLDPEYAYRAPQIYPLSGAAPPLGSSSDLTCPAPIARFWPDRARYAGTYDDAWLADFHAAPFGDYPADFDLRFFHAAHPALIHPTPLRGDETLELRGLLAEWPQWHAHLPGWQVIAYPIQVSDTTEPNTPPPQHVPMRLDTLHVDLDSRTVRLLWRLTLPQTRGIATVQVAVTSLSDATDTSYPVETCPALPEAT